jgi:nicotinate phosphoribosyltransferase
MMTTSRPPVLPHDHDAQVPVPTHPLGRGAHLSPILVTDLYELTMLQAYFEQGLRETAVFSLFVRRLPARRNYLLACGLDDVLTFLEAARFDGPALAYLRTLGRFSDRFLQFLEQFRFTGHVHAVPEGTPIFGNEPILEIVAPIAEAQLVETFVMNQVHLQMTLASKATRIVEAAQGRQVVDFGLRRIHGIDAGVKAARAFHIAGVHATSNVAAGQIYGVTVAGTMAHSYIQAHDDEYDAFRAFAELYPDTVLLVDTYDTLDGVHKVIDLAGELGSRFRVSAVRLDSGDICDLSCRARRLLDAAGLQKVGIFASANLDEEEIARLIAAGAPVDGFGVGAAMGVSADAPSLDIVYKLVEYAGRGRVKLSPEKVLLPGRKQIFRVEQDGVARYDVLARHDEPPCGRPLLRQVMKDGIRLPEGRVTLDEARTRRQTEVDRLPSALRAIQPASVPYRIDVSPGLARDLERAQTRSRL